MAKNLEWPSINQLAAQTRLIQAWKSLHEENNCLKEVLHLRPKGNYNTRLNNVDLLDTGVEDLYGSAGFAHATAKLWNKAPASIKDAPSISIAKREIRKWVEEEIPF